LDAFLFLAPEFPCENPPPRRLGMRFVARLRPALASIDRKAPVEWRGEHGADEGIASPCVSNEHAERVAVYERTVELAHAGVHALRGTHEADGEVEEVDAGRGHRAGGRFPFGHAPVVGRHRDELVLAERRFDLQQRAELAALREAVKLTDRRLEA